MKTKANLFSYTANSVAIKKIDRINVRPNICLMLIYCQLRVDICRYPNGRYTQIERNRMGVIK